jgi:hypothetical protein
MSSVFATGKLLNWQGITKYWFHPQNLRSHNICYVSFRFFALFKAESIKRPDLALCSVIYHIADKVPACEGPVNKPHILKNLV